MVALFSSHGVTTFWTTSPLKEGTEYAIDYPSYLSSMTAIDITSDVIILSLPLPVIRQLNMTTEKKIMVFGIFMLGSL